MAEAPKRARSPFPQPGKAAGTVRAPLIRVCFLVALLALVSNGDVGADQLLINGDFENGVSGWQVLGGRLSSENAAGAVTIDPGPTARVFQSVAVTPGGSYRLSGLLLSADSGVERAQLSLVLYEPSGRLLEVLSAGRLQEPGSWSSGVLVPCEAARGEVELLVHGDAGSAILVDDLRLESLTTPDPCPSPTPTATSPPPAPAPSATIAPPPPVPTATPTIAPPPPPTAPPSPSPTAPVADTAPSPEATPTPTVPFGPQAPAPAAPETSPTPSHGVLVNGGFEAAEDGMPLAWRSFGGVLTQVDAPVRSGRFAAGFTSSTSATKWVYQTVAVTPAAWYALDGYVYLNDPDVEAALLRISWYASADGSGSALATVDSTSQLEEPAARYRYLTTGPVQAPPGARSAKARVLLRPSSAASAVIYIDDVSFRPAAPAESDGAVAASAGRPSSSRSSDRSAGGRTLVGTSPSDGASPSQPSNAPLPTPVLRRSSQPPAESELPSGGGPIWWPWALAGSVAVAVAAWEARRRLLA